MTIYLDYMNNTISKNKFNQSLKFSNLKILVSNSYSKYYNYN